MSGKSIKFGDEKVNKRSFYKNKEPFKVEDIDISKILVSKKETYGEKSFRYFIGYNDDVVRPLCITIPQMVGYFKHFKNNDKDSKRMSFSVTDNKLLKNYSKIWEKISNSLDKEFDSEPVYGNNDKYI